MDILITIVVFLLFFSLAIWSYSSDSSLYLTSKNGLPIRITKEGVIHFKSSDWFESKKFKEVVNNMSNKRK